jgi:hypothetical protein
LTLAIRSAAGVPLAADVGDGDAQSAVGQRGHVRAIATEPLREPPGDRDVVAGHARRRDPQEPLLDVARVGLEALGAPRRRPVATRARTVSSRRAFSHGFWTKSPTPSRMVATASDTVDHAVMTTTGRVGIERLHARDQLEAFVPDVVSRA